MIYQKADVRVFLNQKRKKILNAACYQGIQRITQFSSQICLLLNKCCSSQTIKRILKSENYSWRRLRKSLKNRRNSELFATCKVQIERLKEQALFNEIELCYLDETGVNLSPNVPYAWQEKGNTIILPASRTKGISIMGILNPLKQEFYGDIYHGSANSDCVIHTLDKFTESIQKKTVLILDNASIHRANIVKDKIEEWESKGLYLKFIPPYSPELNLIEILWKHLKYYWIEPNDYQNMETLQMKIIDILQQYGNKYSISFD